MSLCAKKPHLSVGVRLSILDCGGLHLLCGALAIDLAQEDLAQTHRLGRNLHVLILFDVLQSLLQREDNGRYDHRLVVRTRRTHIGQLLGLGDVDCDVATA